MTKEVKKIDLDIEASKAGGYVEQLTATEANELASYDIRAAYHAAKTLGRPLSSEELNQLKYN